MARTFKVNEAQDRDLNILVNRFLQLRPDYLPLTSRDNALLLLPYSDNRDCSDIFSLSPELIDPGSLFDNLTDECPAADAVLM